jgi:plasmid maintenance system antidote protein VapI
MAMPTKSRSSTIAKGSSPAKVQKPIHPGEVLLEDFLRPMEVTQYREFWLNLQNRYDLERERDRLGDRLNAIEVWTGLARGA